MADIFHMSRRCGFCGGTGVEGGGLECHKCLGVGEWDYGVSLEQDPMPPGEEAYDIFKICNKCDGTGVFEEAPCDLCNGDGKYIWGRQVKIGA